MHEELLSTYGIPIIGINKIGAETGLADVALISVLPVVADSNDDLLWDAWEGSWRDVIILDENNYKYASYNLLENSLAVPENYATLKQLFIDAAGM